MMSLKNCVKQFCHVFFVLINTLNDRDITSTLYSIAFARWSWHLGSGLDQCANARLGVQIWHSRADREHLDSLTCSGRNQCANARSAHLIWHSRADREHLGFFYKKQSKKFKIGHTLGYLYLSVPFGNTLVKCSRSARECQIRCADLAFAHWSWPLHVKLSKHSRSAR